MSASRPTSSSLDVMNLRRPRNEPLLMRIDARSGHCQIVRRQSESSDGEFHYVIRSTHEDHERVAREGELTRA
jgi:hypothetical protein